MKKLRSLLGLSIANVTFAEKRLVYNGPESRNAPSQTAEVPKDQMLPMAINFTKDITAGANGLDKAKFARAKSSPAAQQKMIEDWLKISQLKKTEKDNLLGTDTITEYHLNNKKVNPSKVAKEMHAFLRVKSNRDAIMAAIKAEEAAAARRSAAAAPSRPSEAESPAKFQTIGFSGSSQEQSDSRSRLAESFYKDIVSTKLAQTMIQSEADATAVQNKLNATLNKYGVNVEVTFSGKRINFSIQFNGKVAWPKISSSAQRRKTKSAIVRGIG